MNNSCCINCHKPLNGGGVRVGPFTICQKCKDVGDRNETMLKTGISVSYKNGATVVYKDKK